jgi:hypothetical protein
MSSQPKPADMARYQARLNELVAARDTFRSAHDDHKARALNRKIQAQLKWIRKAQALAAQ